MCVCVGGGGGGGGWKGGGGVGGGGGLANYSIAYEETQSNRVSDFCDLGLSLFPKAILFFTFIAQVRCIITHINLFEN